MTLQPPNKQRTNMHMGITAISHGYSVVQGEATGRAIKLARVTGTPLYVVHVMSKDAAEEVVKARALGQKVWGEVVAGAIGLTDEKWSAPGSIYDHYNGCHSAAYHCTTCYCLQACDSGHVLPHFVIKGKSACGGASNQHLCTVMLYRGLCEVSLLLLVKAIFMLFCPSTFPHSVT